jgi:L-amino acid N-acyltransferase YncA
MMSTGAVASDPSPSEAPRAHRDADVDVIDLADGRTMVIRPTTADDAEQIAALYAGLSTTDRHRRFFGAFMPRAEWCRQWAGVAERGGYGVIVFVRAIGESVGTVVAEAGYALREDGDGDLAITVATPWRGWLGAYLLDRLVRHAAEVGVRNLQAEVLLENGPMLALLRRRDPVSAAHDDGMVRLSIGTSGTTPDWAPGEHRPRILVEVAGRRWSGEAAADEAGMSTMLCSGPAGRVRHGCPVLAGGTCPLASGADAIVVLLDPDDERSRELVEAHRRNLPDTPVLVRPRSAGSAVPGCVELAGDGPTAVGQLLSIIGTPGA